MQEKSVEFDLAAPAPAALVSFWLVLRLEWLREFEINTGWSFTIYLLVDAIYY